MEGKACRTSGPVLGCLVPKLAGFSVLHLPKLKELCPKGALHIEIGHLQVSRLSWLLLWRPRSLPTAAAYRKLCC